MIPKTWGGSDDTCSQQTLKRPHARPRRRQKKEELKDRGLTGMDWIEGAHVYILFRGSTKTVKGPFNVS
jgi:hypothetical protein